MNPWGYHPMAPKRLVLEGVAPQSKLKFSLYDPNRPGITPLTRGRVVYRFNNIEKSPDNSLQGPAAERWALDFSDFRQSGDLQLKIEGLGKDAPPLTLLLRVSEFVYWDAMVPVIRAFYLQRSGVELDDEVTGLAHGLSHAEDALVESPETHARYQKDVTGGWYDGSDYNKYVTPTGLAIGRLLSLYDSSPSIFNTLKLSYPLTEEGLGDLPDFLHEMRWGLDWIMAMQRKDGAFFRKVAGREKVSKGPPDDDTQERFAFGATSQDTAVGAATLAMASRAYRRKEMGYAIKCLLAAEEGWRYLAAHGMTLEVSPDDATGSREYLNPDGDGVYRFWAATELALATGKPVYRQYLLAHYRQIPVASFSWRNPAMLAITDYLARNPQDDPISAWFRPRVIQAADALLSESRRARANNPLATSVTRFEDGASAQLSEQAATLLAAYRLTRDPAYLTAAVGNVDFLLGLNPLSQTFVSGLGARAVQHPCHPWMKTAKATMPGLVVAGPNAADRDGKTPADSGALSYRDDVDACDSNAPSLLYNASFAYILGALNLEFAPAAK